MTVHKLRGVTDKFQGGDEQMRLQNQGLLSGAVILPPDQEVSDPINCSYIYCLYPDVGVGINIQLNTMKDKYAHSQMGKT